MTRDEWAEENLATDTVPCTRCTDWAGIAEVRQAELSEAVDEIRRLRLDLLAATVDRDVAQQEAAGRFERLSADGLAAAVDDLAELSVTPAEVSALLLRILLERSAAAARIADTLAGLAR